MLVVFLSLFRRTNVCDELVRLFVLMILCLNIQFWLGVRFVQVVSSTNEFSYQPSGLLSVYNNVTSVCILIDCWSWSIKGHTHRWHQMHPIRSCQRTCFSFFMPPKSFNRSFEFLLYKRDRLHFPVLVYCNRSQKAALRFIRKQLDNLPSLSSC